MRINPLGLLFLVVMTGLAYSSPVPPAAEEGRFVYRLRICSDNSGRYWYEHGIYSSKDKAKSAFWDSHNSENNRGKSHDGTIEKVQLDAHAGDLKPIWSSDKPNE